MRQPIASLELLGGSEPASKFRVDVSIFAPEFIDPPNMHRCDIEIRPLVAGPRTLFGEGSLQALSLAVQHAINCLEAYVDGGGTLFHPDGTTFEPGSFGVRPLQGPLGPCSTGMKIKDLAKLTEQWPRDV